MLSLTLSVDKEKALLWIEALQTHPETSITEGELNLAAKIVENYENSTNN